jgi:hypothetical protein
MYTPPIAKPLWVVVSTIVTRGLSIFSFKAIIAEVARLLGIDTSNYQPLCEKIFQDVIM